MLMVLPASVSVSISLASANHHYFSFAPNLNVTQGAGCESFSQLAGPTIDKEGIHLDFGIQETYLIPNVLDGFERFSVGKSY